ncbi:MAG: hypothetical protein QF441_04365 [Bacteriovoracaceae bacterium]|jgi:hypothetical protein|nr:hypothetical protein [Halobacteriovoraceae bacterium]MDP7319815.1 hypothetical protein [Bacteriovoracaceae bacterium]
MKRLIKISYILFFITNIGLAQENFNQERNTEFLLKNEYPDNITEKEINTSPELFLLDESLIQSRDTDSGVITSPYYTFQDKNRLSIAYSMSHDYEDIAKVQEFSATYSKKISDSYRNLWWALQLKRVNAKYNAIADPRTTSSSEPNSVANTVRGDNIQVMNIIGVGLAYQFRVLQEAFNFQKTIEYISVYGNYIIHQDKTDNEKYNGMGFNAEYLLSYRFSPSFFYAGKISYHWALVEREQIGEEKLHDRSLVFGWTSIGIELGYIF